MEKQTFLGSLSFRPQYWQCPGETKVLWIGILLGSFISWHMNSIVLGIFDKHNPELIEDVLVLTGGLCVLGLAISARKELTKPSLTFLFLVSVVAILLFGNALEGYWADPPKDGFISGGLIPSSDADEWVAGGYRLLENSKLSSGDQRRPVNAALHALRIFVTEGNLQDSIMLAALVAGICTLIAAIELSRNFGWIGASIFFFMSFSVIREYLPLTMTEVHGYILGALALALLLRAASVRSLGYFFVGLALLALGLNARAGPYFVLPAILIWGVVNLESNRTISIKAMICGFAGIVLGFLVPKIFLELWGAGENIQNANFAPTLYSMSVGSGRWDQAYLDFPREFFHKMQPEGDIWGKKPARFLYQLALHNIWEKPLVFLSYYVGQLFYFPWVLVWVLGVQPALGFLAAIWVSIRWREPLPQFIIISFVGLFLSAPFILEVGHRTFAAVFPLTASVSAVGAGFLIRLTDVLRKSPARPRITTSTSTRSLLWLGLTLLIVVGAGPVLAKWLHKPLMPESVSGCEESDVRLIFRDDTITYLNVFQDDRLDTTRAPKIRKSDLLETFSGNWGPEPRQIIGQLPPPFAVLYGLFWDATEINDKAGRGLLFVTEHIDLERSRYFLFCSLDVFGTSRVGTIKEVQVRATEKRM
jgi:hypothetical protein